MFEMTRLLIFSAFHCLCYPHL